MTTVPIHPALILTAAGNPSFWDEPWSWEPAIVVPMLLFAAMYVAGAIRRGSLHRLCWRYGSFAGGWLSLFFALTSPIHELGEELFSAHMLQHEIMMLIAAPLIAASHPGATLLWAFAREQRSQIGGGVHRIESWAVWRYISAPLHAWILGAAALWLWHIPALYEAALRSDWMHAAQHLSFFLTSVIFWSALYGMGRSATNFGSAALYVFGTAAHCSALGALLTFSSVLWYPAYAPLTPRWGLTPLMDQQLGGVIMWVPSGVVFIVIALALMARWIAESDRRLKFSSVAALLDKERQA